MKKAHGGLAAVVLVGVGLLLATQVCQAGWWSSGAADIPYATLEQGRDGVWATPKLLVATGPREWSQAMSEMEMMGELLGPAPAPPDVDWNRELVVLVTSGAVQNDSYSVSIVDVRRTGNVGYLKVEVLQAPPTSSQLTCSYHLVRLERRGLRRFETEYEYRAQDSAGAGLVALKGALTDDSVTQWESPAAAEPVTLTSTWGAVKGLYR